MKLYNTKAIARYLDLSERRVRQLRDEKVITEYSGGLYDLIDTTHKYINYLRQRNPESDERVDYNTERAKFIRAKRMNEEYELQLKERQLHKSEDIEQVLTDLLANFKAKLMAVPAKLSPILAKKSDKTEIYKLLKGSIDEALNEISDFDLILAEENTEDGKKDC